MYPLSESGLCLDPLVSLLQSLWIQDDARRASEEIYRQIRQQAGLSRSGSVGDMMLQPEPLGVMTQGRLILCRRESEQPQTAQSNVRRPVGEGH